MTGGGTWLQRRANNVRPYWDGVIGYGTWLLRMTYFACYECRFIIEGGEGSPHLSIKTAVDIQSPEGKNINCCFYYDLLFAQMRYLLLRFMRKHEMLRIKHRDRVASTMSAASVILGRFDVFGDSGLTMDGFSGFSYLFTKTTPSSG